MTAYLSGIWKHSATNSTTPYLKMQLDIYKD